MLFLCLPYSLIPYGQFRCFDQSANERKAVWVFFLYGDRMLFVCVHCVTKSPDDNDKNRNSNGTECCVATRLALETCVSGHRYTNTSCSESRSSSS